MAHRSQSSRFLVLFESALQDYQNQTGTTLPNHPLADKLQYCDSVESVTAVLQDQARAFTEFRGGDARIMKSLNTVVSVLDSLSTSTAFGEAIGLVRQKASTDVLHL
jgi:fungal STAND N-terminal Goodbye domain